MKIAKYALILATMAGLWLPWYADPSGYSMNAFFGITQASNMIVYFDARDAQFRPFGIVILLCALLALGIELYADRATASRKYGFVLMLGAVLAAAIALLAARGAELGVVVGLYLSLGCAVLATIVLLLGSGLIRRE